MQLLPEENATMAENTQAPKIKKERHDDQEINQLAMEMVESNKKKMVARAPEMRQQNQVSQQALQRAGGQQMITFYFGKDKDFSSTDSLLPKKKEEKKKGTLDEESAKGKFGWSTIQNIHFPYIYRQDQKFCAVRMVEAKLLNRYLSYLPQELITCIHVRSFYITEIESKLFNEVNVRHCDCQFGREVFTIKDLVVTLTDAECFYCFLETCFKKLVQKSAEQSEYCGFVRINGESVVPYTVKCREKYVPLFYFEGETDTLKLKSEKIEGWELAFLKFCCKVQGIRNELFASDTCSVVSLEDVKQYFPKETQFEDWWPQKTAESMRVVNQGSKLGGCWTKRPPMPITPSSSINANPAPTVPITKPTHIAPRQTNPTSTPANPQHKTPPTPSALNMPSMESIYNQWMTTHAQAQLMAAYQNPFPNIQNFQSLMHSMNPDAIRRATSTHANSNALLQSITGQQRPPPLVRGSNSGTQNAYASAAACGTSAELEALQQLGYIGNHELVNMANLLGASRLPVSTNSVSHHTNSSSAKHSQSKVPPPLISAPNGIRSSEKTSGRLNGIDKHKLVDVPSYRPDPSRPGHPYKVKKVLVDGKVLHCINLSHYNFNEPKMVAAQDIVREFLPSATVAECVDVFSSVLQTPVYKANWHQVCLLTDSWTRQQVLDKTSPHDLVPLIKASDLMQYLTQIKYIFEKRPQRTSKRLKT